MEHFKIVIHLNHEGKLPEVMEIIEFDRPRGMTAYEFKNYIVLHMLDHVGMFGKDAEDQTAFVFRNSKLAFYVDCITRQDMSRIDSVISIVRMDGRRHFYRSVNLAC